MVKGRRAVIYKRQSTHREESISMELQEDSCRAYCRQRGYKIVDVKPDPGVSGLRFEKRPGIREAIELVEAGRADVIVVYRWSRLSRRDIHQAVILDRVEQAGGRVESASEPVDTTTAGGKFSRRVLLGAAALESEQKSEQWKEAQARRVDQGLMPGGAPPFGYMKPEKRGDAPVQDPETAPVVKKMYADYLKGHGPQRIARDLNAAGIRSVRGNTFTVSTVSRILDSGFAAGLIHLGVNVRDREGRYIVKADRPRPPVWKNGTHKAIIDPDTWERYQRERASRRTVHPKSRQPKWHLGGKLAVCGRCGGGLIVNTWGKDENSDALDAIEQAIPDAIDPDAPVLLAAVRRQRKPVKSQAICSNYKGGRTCDGVWINRVSLETVVALWLGGHVTEWADQQDAMSGVDSERTELLSRLEAARADQRKLADGLRNAARLVALGDMAQDDYRAAKGDADRRHDEVTTRINDIQTRLDLLSPDADVYERIGRGAEGQTPDEWHALLKRIIKQVAVSPDTIAITPWRGEPSVYERAVVAPRRPARQEVTARDPHTGRFARADAAS